MPPQTSRLHNVHLTRTNWLLRTATDCYGLLRYATVRYVTYFDPYFFGKRGMGTRHDLQLHVAPLLGFSERNLHMVPVKWAQAPWELDDCKCHSKCHSKTCDEKNIF